MSKVMNDIEFLKRMNEVDAVQQSHNVFYELAEKYGFCTPWCHIQNDCEICEKREIIKD